MSGQAEGPHEASQGLNKGCGNARETLDQRQGKVDLTLHAMWGRVVHVWKVLQGLGSGTEWRNIREERGGQKQKQGAEIDEHRHKDEEERKKEIWDWEGKSACANLWPVTCHLSQVKSGRGGSTSGNHNVISFLLRSLWAVILPLCPLVLVCLFKICVCMLCVCMSPDVSGLTSLDVSMVAYLHVCAVEAFISHFLG